MYTHRVPNAPNNLPRPDDSRGLIPLRFPGVAGTPGSSIGTGSGAELHGRLVEAEELPRRFGAFTLVGVLGEGSWGRVYLALQESPSREVAVKVLRPEATSKESVRRFAIEAEALGRLAHPGIARIYESGTCDGRPYIVMERVEGRVLTELCRAERVEGDERARVALVASGAEALDHAHRQGVIHRDLKPSNIMVDGKGQARILDFGVARLVSAGVSQTLAGETLGNGVMAGSWVGTVRYLSPEQASGLPGDTRSDVHALGLVLYELLARRPAYGAEECTLAMLLAMVRSGQPARLRTVNPRCTADMEAIVGRALEKDPSHRYLSAGELAADLRRMLADEPIRARPPTIVSLTVRAMRRNKVATVAVAAAILAGGVGVELWVKSQQQVVEAERESRRTALALLNTVVGPLAPLLGTNKARQDMLEAVGPTLARFASAYPTDESVQSDYARYLELLADAKLEMGQAIQIRPIREQVVEIRERLAAAAHNEDATREADRATAIIKLGDALKEAGDQTTALKLYRRALVVHENMVEARPVDERALSDAAWSCQRVTEWCMREGDLAEAARLRGLHVQLAERYLAVAPERADAHRVMAAGLSARAAWRSSQEDHAGGREDWLRAMAAQDAAAAVAPGQRQDMQMRIAILQSLASIEESLLGNEARIERFTMALETVRALVAKSPDVPARMQLASVLVGMVRAMPTADPTGLRLGWINEAVEIALELDRIKPGDPTLMMTLAVALTQRAMELTLVQEDAGPDSRAALGVLHRALAAAPGDPNVLSRLAEFLYSCPDTSLRDLPRAAELARRACERTGYVTVSPIAVLVEVYRAMGREDEVSKVVEMAIAVAERGPVESRERVVRSLRGLARPVEKQP